MCIYACVYVYTLMKLFFQKFYFFRSRFSLASSVEIYLYDFIEELKRRKFNSTNHMNQYVGSSDRFFVRGNQHGDRWLFAFEELTSIFIASVEKALNTVINLCKIFLTVKIFLNFKKWRFFKLHFEMPKNQNFEICRSNSKNK